MYFPALPANSRPEISEMKFVVDLSGIRYEAIIMTGEVIKLFRLSGEERQEVLNYFVADHILQRFHLDKP